MVGGVVGFVGFVGLVGFVGFVGEGDFHCCKGTEKKAEIFSFYRYNRKELEEKGGKLPQ